MFDWSGECWGLGVKREIRVEGEVGEESGGFWGRRLLLRVLIGGVGFDGARGVSLELTDGVLSEMFIRGFYCAVLLLQFSLMNAFVSSMCLAGEFLSSNIWFSSRSSCRSPASRRHRCQQCHPVIPCASAPLPDEHQLLPHRSSSRLQKMPAPAHVLHLFVRDQRRIMASPGRSATFRALDVPWG